MYLTDTRDSRIFQSQFPYEQWFVVGSGFENQHMFKIWLILYPLLTILATHKQGEKMIVTLPREKLNV